MLTVKCSNCAAELSINSQGELFCPYCGSKFYMSDKDYEEYKKFRITMLKNLAIAADAKAEASDKNAWAVNERVSFEAADGNVINVNYTFSHEDSGVKTYITMDNVIQVFDREHRILLERMKNGLAKLNYPSADIKDVSKYFPRIKAEFELADGGALVVISKPANVFPLYAFGNLGPKHVAWIISRMENFCCVFEFSGIRQGGIDFNSVYINPRTHEAFLYGGWWNSATKSEDDHTDLRAIRKVARAVVGDRIKEAPMLFEKFLNSDPAIDAYTDFADWDYVIEEGFGGHKFTNFSEN